MSFQKLIDWSLTHFSHLPWRNGRTLYTTLVSEIMLQQTTVPTVLNYYQAFLNKYPSIEALAQTSAEELQISWKGLGYYRRAENLLKASRYIIEHFEGKIPLDENLLMEIPGIGRYTASAIMGIGGNLKAMALDSNLERVLGRFYLIQGEKGPTLQKKFYHLFQDGKILNDIEKRGASLINEALMDLGRTLCKPTQPKCEQCPLEKKCLARQRNIIEDYPYPSLSVTKQKKIYETLHLLRVFVLQDKKILVYKKNEKEWLKHQYEVPTFIIETSDKKLTQYPIVPKPVKWPKAINIQNLPFYKTSITKYKITNSILIIDIHTFKKEFSSFSRPVTFKSIDFNKENLASSLSKAFKIITLS